MSAMGPTAVPGIPSRPLCRIQQLSILFPSWRRALRQVPNGSPANLKSATSRTPKPCPRGIKTPCSSKKICFFKTCAATETNLDKVQKSHLRPPPNRPLSLCSSLPTTHGPTLYGGPAGQACTSRRPTLSAGALQIQGCLRRARSLLVRPLASI